MGEGFVNVSTINLHKKYAIFADYCTFLMQKL